MLVELFAIIFGIVAVLAIGMLMYALATGRVRRRTKTEEAGRVSRLEELTFECSKLRERIAELNQLLGEERADHRAKLISVQSDAINEMQAYKASLNLENAKNKRADAQQTAARSRVALVAKIGEHLAPLLDGFPYNLKDCRHVGELFDFLVFDGLEDGEIRDIVFLEVKSRRSGGRITNPRERLLRDAIRAGRVRYDVYVPPVEGAKRDASLQLGPE